jgi:hypothetical protein
VEFIADHDHMVDAAVNVADAVSAAEWLAGLADQRKRVSDVAHVVGVFVGEHQFIHGWDLARATDQPFDAEPATLKTLHDNVRQTFGPDQDQDAVRGQAFAPAVAVAPDASQLDQTLGLLGRDPAWSPK